MSEWHFVLVLLAAVAVIALRSFTRKTKGTHQKINPPETIVTM